MIRTLAWILISACTTATTYNAVPEQCNEQPSVTASGRVIDTDRVQDLRIVAMERTMMQRNGIHYGDTILVKGTGVYDGEWVVEDTMSKRFAGQDKVDFNQGLDIRMMTPEKIGLLNQIKITQIHFAWDRYQDKDIILPKFKMFAEGFHKHRDRDSIVYTLVNYDTTIDQDLERIYTLRDLGYWAYVMIYDKEHCKKKYKDLQRWVNNRVIFARCERFEDYKTN